jgi:hypothetical protein
LAASGDSEADQGDVPLVAHLATVVEVLEGAAGAGLVVAGLVVVVDEIEVGGLGCRVMRTVNGEGVTFSFRCPPPDRGRAHSTSRFGCCLVNHG